MPESQKASWERLADIDVEYWEDFFRRASSSLELPNLSEHFPKPLRSNQILSSIEKLPVAISEPLSLLFDRVDSLAHAEGFRCLLISINEKGGIHFYQEIPNMKPVELALMTSAFSPEAFDRAEELLKANSEVNAESQEFSSDTQRKLAPFQIRSLIRLLNKFSFPSYYDRSTYFHDDQGDHFIIEHEYCSQEQEQGKIWVDHIAIDWVKGRYTIFCDYKDEEILTYYHNCLGPVIRDYSDPLPEFVRGRIFNQICTSDVNWSKKLSAYQKRISESKWGKELVGNSPGFYEFIKEIFVSVVDARVPPTNLLLLGETGTGKTYVARLIHQLIASRRSHKFVIFRAADKGDKGDANLLRGELLGRAKDYPNRGDQAEIGKLKQADKGTLFIDELQNSSIEIQEHLKVIMDGEEVEPLGLDPYRADVLAIMACNLDIEELVQNGKILHDLKRRIQCKIEIPPLRERKGDIMPLAKSFLVNTGVDRIEKEARLALLLNDWTGNVGKLETTIMGAVNKTHNKTIHVENLEIEEKLKSYLSSLEKEEIERYLWMIAEQIAEQEGWAPNAGFGARVAEIAGETEAKYSTWKSSKQSVE